MYSPNSQSIPLDNSGLKSPGGYAPPPRTARSSVKITNPLTNEPVLLSNPAEAVSSPTPGHSSPIPKITTPGSPSIASIASAHSRSGSTAESGALEKKNEFKELIKQRALDAAKAEEEAKKAAEEKIRLEKEEVERKKAEEEEKVRKALEEEAAKKAAEEAAKKAAEKAAEVAAQEAAQEAAADAETKKAVPEEAIQAALDSVNDRIKGVSNPLRCLEKATRPTHEELYKVEYPKGTNKPESKSTHSQVFTYDIKFLMQFQGVVTFPPKENWDSVRSIMNFDKSAGNNRNFSSRSNSSRGGFPQAMGSFGANFRNGDRSASGPNMGASGFQMKGMSRMSSANNLSGMNGMHSKSGRQNSSRRGRNDRSGSNRGERQNNYNNKEYEETAAAAAAAAPAAPAVPVAPLVKSANAWAPRVRTAKTEGDGKLTPELVQRKVKSLLNKMTLEYFDTISDQLLDISAQSKDEKDGRTLRQVIELTFAKAVDEAHWSNMYARFCAKMLAKIDPEIFDEHIRDVKGNLVKGGALFRKYLLNRCQEEFERGWSDQLPTNEDGTPIDAELMSDEYYAAVGAKRRGLGLIRFIGELYFLGMLTERIMHACMQLLLKSPEPSEEVIESVCQLMTTIGARLEENKDHADFFNSYFQKMKDIQNSPGLPSRLRFMLMDIADLRKSGWIDKRKDKGPKTIAEIHEEAKQDKEKQAAALAASSHKGRFPRPNANNNNTNRVSRHDLDRLGNFRTSTPNTFGPGSMFNRGNSSRSGSGGSSRRSNASSPAVPLSKEPSRQSSQRAVNSFALLADDGDKSEEK